MKIVISGYGKMGREIEKAALLKGYEILARIDVPADWKTYENEIRKADMVFEFSTPASAVENIRKCFDMHLPVVVGTTGWNDKIPMVKEWCRIEGQSIFFGSNFSIGVNILYSLAGNLSKIVNKLDDYDISIEEIHHIHKLDAPSGTAIKIADIILAGVERKKKWVNRESQSAEELEVLSVREDEIAGIHTIFCVSGNDTITLKHEALGRKGMVTGALLAAEWMQGRKGWFEMKDMLQLPH